MGVINLETGLTFDEMAWLYSELEDKNAEKKDLIKKDEKNLGVILDKNNFTISMGDFDKEENILVTEFNIGTFAQFYIPKETKNYIDYKKIIEGALKNETRSD